MRLSLIMIGDAGDTEAALAVIRAMWREQRAAYDALPEGGAFIVVENLIDDARRENAFGLLMSLNMLIETKGGFDYSGRDCCGWMK